jgi:hypothetical protein
MHLRTDLVQGTNRKIATKKQKLNTVLNNEIWTNPQIKNHTKGHEVNVTRTQARHKNPEHLHLYP